MIVWLAVLTWTSFGKITGISIQSSLTANEMCRQEQWSSAEVKYFKAWMDKGGRIVWQKPVKCLVVAEVKQ